MHDIPQLFTGRARSCLPSDVTLSAADYPVDLSSATGVKLLKCLRAIQRARLAASPRRLLDRRCRACDTWLPIAKKHASSRDTTLEIRVGS
jgi:hypothetical protein